MQNRYTVRTDTGSLGRQQERGSWKADTVTPIGTELTGSQSSVATVTEMVLDSRGGTMPDTQKLRMAECRGAH